MSDPTRKHHRQKDLLAYVQGFLDPVQQREIEEHLRTCEDCRKTLEEVKRFLPALQEALTPHEMSDERMWANVQRQMRNAPPPREPFFVRMRFPMVLATGGLALAAGLLIVVKPLLQQSGPDVMAQGHQPAQSGGMVGAPHRPQSGGVVAAHHRPTPPDGGPDAGSSPDGGSVP